ncbi:CPBP family intramembrane glutamic endopeptidase [Natrinema salinisoli]|uniref:CPBP family intramembrane glutamic endopeptidase n=1 Tax=Natrinema salinisoli TaxID=2878535 RepID=UPI001CF0D1DD|nr:type II CAAX endopeptidase family protein [Natrinema salinisoli]
MSRILRTENEQLRLPLRLIWNESERRLRSPIRILFGIVIVFLFAGFGSGYRPTLLTDGGPIPEAINSLVRGLPQSMGIVLGVILVSVVLDRRVLSDLGIRLDSHVWCRFAGGFVIGAGITALSVTVGTVTGYYNVSGVHVSSGPAVWLLLVGVTGLSQLLIVVAEELLARGYLITNVMEGLDSIPVLPRGMAAGIAVVIASVFFYLTHSARGAVFGVMAAGLAVLLGVAYVLSGSLAVPIGIHFGVNFAGGLLGTQPMSVSLVQLTSTTTVAETLVLPVEAVTVRLVGAGIAILVLVFWYHSTNGRVRIIPSIVRPTLRWQRNSDASPEQS